MIHKLPPIYHLWTPPQCRYYKPVFDALLQNDIITYELLISDDVKALSENLAISRQVLRAFIKQVEYTIAENLITTSYIRTGTDSLDKLYKNNGIEFNQMMELSGSTRKYQFIAKLLNTSFKQDNIYVLDSYGISKYLKIEASHIIHDGGELLETLQDISSVMDEDERNIVIIDNLNNYQFDPSIFKQLLKRLMNGLNCLIVLVPSTFQKKENAYDTQLHFISDHTLQIIKSPHLKKLPMTIDI